MKKLLIFTSLLIASIYLSSAISMVLTSGTKLDNSSWITLSSVLNKVDVNSNNLNINGKLAVNGKICDADDNCLGECEENHHWDTSSNSCVANAGSEASPGSSCLDLYNKGKKENKAYHLIGKSGKTFQVYCDMTTGVGGRTLIAKSGHAHDAPGTKAAPTNEAELLKFTRMDAETPTGTLINEFLDSSNQIRFKLPYLDQVMTISTLPINNANQIRGAGQVPNPSTITVLYAKEGITAHPRLSLSYDITGISFIYDYNPTRTPPSYGVRGSEKSHEKGPAYVFLR